MTYWMIEEYKLPGTGDGRPRWLQLMSGPGPVPECTWTFYPQKAMQFHRERDAYFFAMLHREWCALAKLTEHCDLLSTPTQGDV